MSNRVEGYQKSASLEAELAYFESLLGPVERQILPEAKNSGEPIVFIMGCARSGSTLVFQYLAESGIFSFPTNFISRFYYAPYIGARLQRMLIECDFRNEVFSQPDKRETYQSSLGKTTGPLAPHEFWYFWRRFFTFVDEQKLSQNELKEIDGDLFHRELMALQSVQRKPLLLKGMILNWNIPYLAKLIGNSFFIHVHRSPLANAQSLIRARQSFFGKCSEWYSFKPPGYQNLLNHSPETQTYWQVLATNQAIRSGLEGLPDDRVISMSYEEFCQQPGRLLDRLSAKTGLTPPSNVVLPGGFECSVPNLCKTWELAKNEGSLLFSESPEMRSH